MAFFRLVKNSLPHVKMSCILVPSSRSHWNKDYKPGTFTKTDTQRIDAAKKYGLDIEEYKPFPEHMGTGDYPMIKTVSADARDPFYPWDKPELKQNYNEPIHSDEDLISEVRYDVSARHRVPSWAQWAQFLGAVFGAFAFYWFMERCKMFPGIYYPRQYPDKVHYTFEMVEPKKSIE